MAIIREVARNASATTHRMFEIIDQPSATCTLRLQSNTRSRTRRYSSHISAYRDCYDEKGSTRDRAEVFCVLCGTRVQMNEYEAHFQKCESTKPTKFALLPAVIHSLNRVYSHQYVGLRRASEIGNAQTSIQSESDDLCHSTVITAPQIKQRSTKDALSVPQELDDRNATTLRCPFCNTSTARGGTISIHLLKCQALKVCARQPTNT
jgi:hypothetical protein